MKTYFIFLVLLLFGMLLQAQSLIKNEVDEFTDDVKKVTSSEIIGISKIDNELNVSMARIGSIHAIYLRPSIDQGCAGGHTNNVIFLFTDGSKISLEEDLAKIDCDDYVTSIYSLSETQLEKFQTIDLKKVRLSMSETYDDFTVDLEMREIVKRMAMIVQ